MLLSSVKELFYSVLSCKSWLFGNNYCNSSLIYKHATASGFPSQNDFWSFMRWLRSEGISGGCPLKLLLKQSQPEQATHLWLISTQVLNILNIRESTGSLGNLFQCSVIHTVNLVQKEKKIGIKCLFECINLKTTVLVLEKV